MGPKPRQEKSMPFLGEKQKVMLGLPGPQAMTGVIAAAPEV
jgi:hypothetical protein